MAFVETKNNRSSEDNGMRSSLVMLGLSSLLGAVSSLGAITSASALHSALQEVVIDRLAAQAGSEQLAEAQVQELAQTVILYGSVAMLCWCFLGALVGAWTYVFIVPDENTNTRRMAAKLVSATGCGVTLTPLVIHYTGIPKDPNLIGGVSTIVAMVSIAVIVDIFPAFRKRLGLAILDKLPRGPEDKQS